MITGLAFTEGDNCEWHRISSLGEIVEPIVTEARNREITEFYWNTDISTKEIKRAYGIASNTQLLMIVGPKTFDHIKCMRCEGPIEVRSRSELKGRLAIREERESLVRAMHKEIAFKELFPTLDLCRDCERILIERWEQEKAAEWQKQNDPQRMPYAEYLQTPEWQATRALAFRRAGFRCQICADNGQLHVHHRTYIRRGCEAPSDLIVLCAGCHQLFHENGKLAERGRADVPHTEQETLQT